MALEPPPTQARDDVGQPADLVEALLSGLGADGRLEVPDDHRERMRAAGGAEQIERVVDVGRPVAQGVVDGVLERAGAAGDAG